MKQKLRYNMWQNSAYMVRRAWGLYKSVVLLCAAQAVTSAGKTVAELLIAPAVLGQLERGAALGQLAVTIVGFTGILLVLAGLDRYIRSNTMYGRIAVRMGIIRDISRKLADTSYPNLLDTRFLAMEEKSVDASNSNAKAAEAIWTTWSDILTNLLGFGAYLALLSGLDWRIILLVAVTSAASYLCGKRINEWGYRHREEEMSCRTPLNYAYETATRRKYAKDIRIFGLQSWLMELWDRSLGLYRAFVRRRERTYLWANVIDTALILVRNGAAYAYLVRLALAGDLTVAQFVLYFGAVGGFAQWVTGILDKFTLLHKQSLEISTVREFLEWPEPFRFGGGAPLPRTDRYELRLENVSFRYPEAAADTIRHMDLTVRPGERLAIVGLNGAGKTTLVKLLCGFLDPTEGRVLLNGQDIREFDRKAYYSLFSAVFQDFSVLEASVAENVAQRVDGIDRERVERCLRQAGLTEKIAALPRGLDTPIGRQVYENGVELSGGQTQRLMLARALYKDAPILLLDEPTAALDPIAESDIYQKYSAMTEGRTSLFISHRLASTRFCDRILYLDHGTIREEGTHDQLLQRSGGYAALFAIQSRYYQEGGRGNA